MKLLTATLFAYSLWRPIAFIEIVGAVTFALVCTIVILDFYYLPGAEPMWLLDANFVSEMFIAFLRDLLCTAYTIVFYDTCPSAAAFLLAWPFSFVLRPFLALLFALFDLAAGTNCLYWLYGLSSA